MSSNTDILSFDKILKSTPQRRYKDTGIDAIKINHSSVFHDFTKKEDTDTFFFMALNESDMLARDIYIFRCANKTRDKDIYR